MHSPRAQADKRLTSREIKRLVEEAPNVALRQGERRRTAGRRRSVAAVVGVRVRGGADYRAPSSHHRQFLQALMHTGESQTAGGGRRGRTDSAAARSRNSASNSAASKPARRRALNGRTIDFDRLELQPGDEQPQPFSFLTSRISTEQLPCWIGYTNEAVHDLIRANLHRAPMYSGQIASRGPRYCPSIEDKVVRFADKDRHQLF